MNGAKMRLIDRIADRVDLTLDLLTLGEYGLERLEGDGLCETTSARDAGCEGGGRRGRREALPPARIRGLQAVGHAPSPQPAG